MNSLMRLVTLAALMCPAGKCLAENVHTLLVLAVDVSSSVNLHRWRVQQSGYVAAFRDPEVLEALRHRRIAVTFTQWSSAYAQEQSVGWRIIQSDADAIAFSDELAQVTRRYADSTMIGMALMHAKHLIDHAPVSAQRMIIDISGDGIDNGHEDYGYSATPLNEARKKVLESGIVINGLPIKILSPMIQRENANIDTYYQENVIGGAGSFIETVHDGDDPDAFRRALIRKLLRELVAEVQ